MQDLPPEKPRSAEPPGSRRLRHSGSSPARCHAISSGVRQPPTRQARSPRAWHDDASSPAGRRGGRSGHRAQPCEQNRTIGTQPQPASRTNRAAQSQSRSAHRGRTVLVALCDQRPSGTTRTLPPFGAGDEINCDQQTTTQIRLIWVILVRITFPLVQRSESRCASGGDRVPVNMGEFRGFVELRLPAVTGRVGWGVVIGSPPQRGALRAQPLGDVLRRRMDVTARR
jgi:hypothetical protein